MTWLKQPSQSNANSLDEGKLKAALFHEYGSTDDSKFEDVDLELTVPRDVQIHSSNIRYE